MNDPFVARSIRQPSPPPDPDAWDDPPDPDAWDDPPDVPDCDLWEDGLDRVTLPCKACGQQVRKIGNEPETWAHLDATANHPPVVHVLLMERSISDGNFKLAGFTRGTG